MKIPSLSFPQFGQWLKEIGRMSVLPSNEMEAHISYPGLVDRNLLESLTPDCFLPIDEQDYPQEEGNRILVLGAGGGEEIVRFLRKGFEVVGVETDRALARRTKVMLEKIGEDPSLLMHCDRLEIPRGMGQFDLIFFSGDYYSRIIGSQRRVDFLKELHKHIKPKGKLYFEFEMRPEKGIDSYFFRLMPFFLIRLMRSLLHRGEPMMEVGVRMDEKVPQLKHYFRRDEIKAEIKEARFAIDDLFTGSSGSAYCRKSCPLMREAVGLDAKVLNAVS